MVWLTENIQACLRDFLAAATSMARKRHLASSARGFLCFCLMARIGVQKVQGFQKVQGVQLRPIRLFRARMNDYHTGCPFTAQLDFYISIHFF